jgi:hypothetical protein
LSPDTSYRPEREPQNPITELVLKDPALVHEFADDGLVIAVRSELLVPSSARLASSDLERELKRIAREVGTFGAQDTGGARRQAADAPGQDRAQPVEIWRLDDPERDSITEARRLRRLGPTTTLRSRRGSGVELPSVSPNHVTIVSGGHWDACPAGPPGPASPPRPDPPFIEPWTGNPGPQVVVLDTGYIVTDPPHLRLDERVASVPGLWLDTSVDPAEWKPNPPDEITVDADGSLVQIVGHGTFIAGLIAHGCPAAAITVVGHRDQDMPIGPPTPAERYRLWASEVAVAHSLLQYAEADVIQCGFSFPTLDDFASLPFAVAMEILSAPDAPRPGIAVVSPAGNEESPRRYWPAALPDVIGVAATNRRQRHRAHFSNWGWWVDCCARGQDVRSTYIDWEGPVEGDPVHDIETFTGWARWDGTSFASPKVAAAIAQLLVDDPQLEPIEAYELLIAGLTDVRVTQVTDYRLSPGTGVTLPELHLG